MKATTQTRHTRRYDIDALRVIAFGLLILYHCGMFYVADWGWHIKSNYTATWLQEPMMFLNQWRMSLLFVISGLALALVEHRYSRLKLAGRRLWRLMLPLLFGMAVVVAPQHYYEALNKGLIDPGFWNFYGRYLTFQDFPGEAWGGENVIVWSWNHLWYLPYIIFYTLLALVCGPALRAAGIDSWFRSLRGLFLVLLPLIPLLLNGLFVFPSFPGITHDLISDAYAHIMYGTLFIYGYLVGADAGWWEALESRRRALLTTAICAYLLLRTQEFWLGENPDRLLETLSLVSIYLNRWVWILAVMAFAFRYLNRPQAWIGYATAAVFPWYILHQTLTVVLGGTLSPMSLGPVLEPASVVGGTVLGCYVLYEYVIRRVVWLQPLFGMPIKTAPPVERPVSRDRVNE
ncbi:MAG: acyltransferase family protein [Pseudomonadota bacterium]